MSERSEIARSRHQFLAAGGMALASSFKTLTTGFVSSGGAWIRTVVAARVGVS
jgi:hypothetical protein